MICIIFGFKQVYHGAHSLHFKYAFYTNEMRTYITHAIRKFALVSFSHFHLLVIMCTWCRPLPVYTVRLLFNDLPAVVSMPLTHPHPLLRLLVKPMPTFSSSDVGKRVVVQGYDGIKGTIRFVGEHAEDGTARVGVEMDDSVGKNNGKVKVSEEDIHKKK